MDMWGTSGGDDRFVLHARSVVAPWTPSPAPAFNPEAFCPRWGVDPPLPHRAGSAVVGREVGLAFIKWLRSVRGDGVSPEEVLGEYYDEGKKIRNQVSKEFKFYKKRVDHSDWRLFGESWGSDGGHGETEPGAMDLTEVAQEYIRNKAGNVSQLLKVVRLLGTSKEELAMCLPSH